MDNAPAVINSIASYLPEKVLSNNDLEKFLDTSDEWIVTRTGIRERRIAASDEFTSTMGARAAKAALERAHASPDEVDLIIVATMTPDYLCPSTAALVQKEIGAWRAAAFDLSAACSGFVYGLSMAKACIESRMYRTILLVASEKNSAFLDYTNRNTCIVFGDGASACVVRCGGSGLRVVSTHLGASGAEYDLVHIPAGGCRLPSSPSSHQDRLHCIQMNGKELFKHAVRRMEESIQECLDHGHIQTSDIRWFVPHQANIRIIEAVGKRFAIPSDRVAITIDSFANTSAASIPITLDLLLSRGSIQPMDRVLLTAIGGGLTWGSALLVAQ